MVVMVQVCACGCTAFEDLEFGVAVCLVCGTATTGAFCFDRFVPSSMMTKTYTRRKRFMKYLNRAMRSQSTNTVPPETWKYLIQSAPFQDARGIVECLKAAKHLRRKCYDSLPLFTSKLCRLTVPYICQAEKRLALFLFDRIDRSLTGKFISYLFLLEYILKRIGRGDMTKFLNCIVCTKRRKKYQGILDGVLAPHCEHLEATVRNIARQGQ